MIFVWRLPPLVLAAVCHRVEHLWCGPLITLHSAVDHLPFSLSLCPPLSLPVSLRRSASLFISPSPYTINPMQPTPHTVHPPINIELSCCCTLDTAISPNRYVFVHSFENTGEAAVMRSLASHPWVRLHGGQGAVDGEGSSLTSVFSSPRDREGMTETVLSEVNGCEPYSGAFFG